MDWHSSIDHPSPLFNMFKPERPLIDIPSASHSAHRDPLRTPEDGPFRHQHAPWYATQQLPHIEDVYPFDDEHTRFPDVEDAGWAIDMVSPPSPSRRNSLELEPLPEQEPQYTDIEIDDPPILSPPSPCRRPLSALPSDDGDDWPPSARFDDSDCPQLSPPSPINRITGLPPLEFDSQSLFVEDIQPLCVETPRSQSPHFTPLTSLETCLRTEHRALLSLRDRTLYAERTSRARTHALRGCERDLGRAVAALRAAPNPEPFVAPHITIPFSKESTPVVPDLHAYRAAATRVMLERSEEKRRRKKDKERLKELRVVLGVGVDALLHAGGITTSGTGFEANPHSSDGATMGLGIRYTPPTRGLGLEHAMASGPPHPGAMPFGRPPDMGSTLGLSPGEIAPALNLGLGLGLALNVPPPPSPSAEERKRALAERTFAMRRLVARMTMRRRDMGMRSLIEAGTLAVGEDGDEASEGIKEARKPRGPSALARLLAPAEDMEDETDEITRDMTETVTGLEGYPHIS